jgi:hypothetical protein
MQSLPSIVRPIGKKVAPVLMAPGLLGEYRVADHSALSFDLGFIQNRA